MSKEACKQIRKADPLEHILKELDAVIEYIDFRQGASVLEILMEYETLGICRNT